MGILAKGLQSRDTAGVCSQKQVLSLPLLFPPLPPLVPPPAFIPAQHQILTTHRLAFVPKESITAQCDEMNATEWMFIVSAIYCPQLFGFRRFLKHATFPEFHRRNFKGNIPTVASWPGGELAAGNPLDIALFLTLALSSLVQLGCLMLRSSGSFVAASLVSCPATSGYYWLKTQC